MNNYMKVIINALKLWVNENLADLDAKISNKVDTIDGKGLSTEDFTTEYKDRLNSITIPLSDDYIPEDIVRTKDVDCILNIDYNAVLAFDTSEVIFGENTSSVLGQAILGQMVLA